MLDILLGDYKFYRKLVKGIWYFIRIKGDRGNGIWIWTRKVIKGTYIIKVENYNTNKFYKVMHYL